MLDLKGQCTEIFDPFKNTLPWLLMKRLNNFANCFAKIFPRHNADMTMTTDTDGKCTVKATVLSVLTLTIKE